MLPPEGLSSIPLCTAVEPLLYVRMISTRGTADSWYAYQAGGQTVSRVGGGTTLRVRGQREKNKGIEFE